MAMINIDKLYLATLTKDAVGTENLTFGVPEYIPDIQKLDAKVKTNTAKLYTEGILREQNTTLEDVEISFDLATFTNTQAAKYLGHHIATEGGVYSKENDVAPYIALLIEYTKSNNKKGYKVFYKGQLTEPDDNIKQKEGKIDYQNYTVSSTFQPLINNGMWKYTIEEDDADCPIDINTKFFASVIIPTEKVVTP